MVGTIAAQESMRTECAIRAAVVAGMLYALKWPVMEFDLHKSDYGSDLALQLWRSVEQGKHQRSRKKLQTKTFGSSWGDRMRIPGERSLHGFVLAWLGNHLA